MRQENLTTIKGGLNRLRTKGAALKDSLFELLNGQVTSARTVRSRPGTASISVLPAGTVGLVSFDGKLQVFASSVIPGIDENLFTLNVLRHPTDSAQTVSIIHFAEPFLGALYVSAGFTNGDTFHYWLQITETWAANTVYTLNSLIQPSVVNGFAYRPSRNGGAFPAWTAGTPRALNDNIEPTVYSGFYFTAIQVIGSNPRSGDVEPIWPVEDGAIIVEDTDIGTPANVPTPTPPQPPPPVPCPVFVRYGVGPDECR